MKAFVLAAAIALPVAPVIPAAANCSGNWGSYGYSGTCSGYRNGNSYRLNVDGGSYGPTRVNGTVDGHSVRGTVNGNTFRGTVNGRYVTCNSSSCY